MDKLVNVYAKTAIRSVTPVICGTHKNVVMNTRDILKCICMRAVVEEVFEDGSTIILTAKNYDKNNMSNATLVLNDEEAMEEPDVDEVVDSVIEGISKEVDSTCTIESIEERVPHKSNPNIHTNKKKKNKNHKK